MTHYRFGYYTETPDGHSFTILKEARCDGDAQAELQARHALEWSRPLDLDLRPITSVIVRRADAEWSVSGVDMTDPKANDQ